MIKNSYQPIIIIGAARSGTNMLRDILTRLPNVCTWDCDEVNPVWHFGNVNKDTDELQVNDLSPSIIRYIESRFKKISKRNKSSFVVEKTCANSLRPEFVYSVQPQAKYIIIYRDGRDAVASAIKRWHSKIDFKYTLEKARYVPLRSIIYYALNFIINRLNQFFSKNRRISSWGPKYRGMKQDLKMFPIHIVAARQWKYSITYSLEFFTNKNNEQFYSISYEDFVRKPAENIISILSFIGYKDIDNVDISSLVSTVSSSSIGKWKKDLTDEQIREILPEINSELKQLGYT